MKIRLSKIAKDLEQGKVSENEARTLLLGLLIVSESVLATQGLTIKPHGYGLYQLRQDGGFLLESDKIGCHERAMEIIENYSR